jgi:hypothetical protein
MAAPAVKLTEFDGGYRLDGVPFEYIKAIAATTTAEDGKTLVQWDGDRVHGVSELYEKLLRYQHPRANTYRLLPFGPQVQA